MRNSTLLKTTAAMGAALTMTCVMATGAFADQVYSISDATISVGQTWSFSYSGMPNSIEGYLSSEYIERGPNMADTEGVLKYVSTETTGRMTTVTYEAMMPGTCVVTLRNHTFLGGDLDSATVTVTGDGQTSGDDSWEITGPSADDTTKADDTKTDDTAKGDDAKTDAPKADTVKPAAPAAAASSSEDNTPAVDTRTAQQKEIDEAIANGTWGIEYTTCQKCGYHNWTRQGNVYVCDTCGNTTTTVVGPKGVKGYVGSGAIAAVAPKASAPETRYATAAEAQAAADKREADYAAAVAAFQKQIAAQNAAYLAALGK